MITKINSGLVSVTKRPIRAYLQKTSILGLGVLAGSSMSGWHGPHFEPTEMVIPNGLTFQEKAYYLLKGKLPNSVYERWFARTDEYVASHNDQLVTINIGDGKYLGDIVEAPHDVGTTVVNDDAIGCGQDISDDIVSAISGNAGDIDSNDDDSSSAVEIFKHFFNVDL